MSHSTSLSATGSEMLASISVALLVAPRRTLSIALSTNAMSASEVAGVGASASGACGSACGLPASRGSAAGLAADAPDAPGRADGRGTAVFGDAEVLSLDL